MRIESRTPAAPQKIGLASYRVFTPLGIAGATTIRNLQIMFAGNPADRNVWLIDDREPDRLLSIPGRG